MYEVDLRGHAAKTMAIRVFLNCTTFETSGHVCKQNVLFGFTSRRQGGLLHEAVQCAIVLVCRQDLAYKDCT